MTRWERTSSEAPARNTSAWSMWLAPATSAWTSVSTLRPGEKPPSFEGMRTMVSTSASRSSRFTSVATSNSPALATRPGSSKVTAIRSIPRDTELTGSASANW